MASTAHRWRRRELWAVSGALLAALLSSLPVLGSVRWTSPTAAAPAGAWNTGQGITRTANWPESWLHVQYSRDDIDPAGLYYRRGNPLGTSWQAAQRVNPADEPGENGAILGLGKIVYVAWTTGSHASPDYDPAAARGLRVRINTANGDPGGWLAPRIVGTMVRVGRPWVAGGGGIFYVVVTDADTGLIWLARNDGDNTESGDWPITAVGSTTRTGSVPGDGFDGRPVVAVSYSSVLVAWIDSNNGTILAKVSTDFGKTWPTSATTLAKGRVWGLSASGDVGGLRIGVAWARDEGIRARLYREGTWRSTSAVATFGPSTTYRRAYGTAIALAAGRVDVLYAACTRTDCRAGSSNGVSIRWRESPDFGGTWSATTTIASYTAGSGRRINEYPSIYLMVSGQRFVSYNAAPASRSTSHLFVEVGTGKP